MIRRISNNYTSSLYTYLHQPQVKTDIIDRDEIQQKSLFVDNITFIKDINYICFYIHKIIGIITGSNDPMVILANEKAH